MLWYTHLSEENRLVSTTRKNQKGPVIQVLDPTSAYWSPGRKPAGWWEPLRTEDNKDSPPPELMMYEEYQFRFMGLENKEEADGDVESGKSATTNLFSSEDRIIEGNSLTIRPLFS